MSQSGGSHGRHSAALSRSTISTPSIQGRPTAGSSACYALANSLCLLATEAVTFLGRNHAGRPRHRLVRAEGTRLGLAGADAWQPDAPATVPDERGDVRGRPQDHPPPFDRAGFLLRGPVGALVFQHGSSPKM